MPDTVYVLDANVFIHAARRYYAFDIAPGFWANLARSAQEGRVISIDQVHAELRKGGDDLQVWTDEVFRPWFQKTDGPDVVTNFAEIMEWVQRERRFTEAARAQFADGADGWLIAYARAENCVVVTEEVSRPASKAKVFIPDVCEPFGVPCLNTFQMMREAGIRLT